MEEMELDIFTPIVKETKKKELINENDANTTNEDSIFIGKSANQTLMDAMAKPTPKCLWQSMWYEFEVCCLFSDTNLGKSILAVQIAIEIAHTQPVALFDFELSDKQLQQRYTSENGVNYVFPENLFRYEINPYAQYNDDFEMTILQGIENVVRDTDVKIVIIDNLTYMCLTAEKSDAAAVLMMRLMQLKREYGLSILVIAHTPKRPLSSPITQNDLAGSKKICNFIDSSFSIGKSYKDNNLRYVKQIKCRQGAFTYDADNVLVYKIEKIDGNFLSFVLVGYANEREHLKELSDNDYEARKKEASEMKKQGKSNVEIAAYFEVTEGAVRKWFK